MKIENVNYIGLYTMVLTGIIKQKTRFVVMVESTYVYRDGILNGGLKLFILSIILVIIMSLIFNLIPAFIAMNMAKKRGLRSVPAFFAGLFSSFVSLFFIAMFPKKEHLNDMQ